MQAGLIHLEQKLHMMNTGDREQYPQQNRCAKLPAPREKMNISQLQGELIIRLDKS
jgi:hypothetical protein